MFSLISCQSDAGRESTIASVDPFSLIRLRRILEILEIGKSGDDHECSGLGRDREAIGGIAIIISLFYVGVQIRQSTKANRAATTQAFMDSFNHPSEHLIGNDFVKVYSRGIDGLGQLEGSERIQFTVWCMNVSRLWESYYFQWKSGDFDSHIWKGFETQLSDLYSYQGVRDFWGFRKHHFSDEFQEFVSRMVVDKSSAGIYGENMSRSV